FHMVTGRPPFEAPTTRAVLAQHLHEAPPDPRELRPQLGEGTAYIIEKLLAKERDDRYPDAATLVADIEKALRGESVGPRLAPFPRVRRVAAREPSTSSVVLTLVVILALIGIVVAILADRLQSESRRRNGETKERVRPPPPTPADTHQAAAERAWAEADAYADAHPADLLGAIARLRDVERQFHDTPLRERAAARRLRLEADLERRNRDALRGLVERAEALVGETRHADALALFQKLPPELAADAWRDRVAAAKAAIERQATEAFHAALARGDALAKTGELDEAVRAYEAAGASLPDAWRDEAAARIAAVRRRQKEQAERAAAQREAAQLGLLAQVLELYRARNCGEAIEFLKTHAASAPAERREELEAELAEAAKLQEFWARADLGAQRAIGQAFVVRGIQGELTAARNGRLTIRTRGGSFSEEMRNLGTDQILALALPGYASVDAPLAAARFLLAEGKPQAAEGRLKAAGTGGAKAAALRARLRRFEAAALFAAASKDLAEARKLLAAGDTAGAVTALRGFLTRYGEPPAAATLRLEAQRLLDRATPPQPSGWGAVGGKAIARPGGRVRNTPDDPLYLAERFGPSAYRIAVANGTYTVRLHFAETFPGVTEVGQRVFSVAIEGQPALRDFDVLKQAGGRRFFAIIMAFDVEVSDGELTIEFTPKAQSPMINGIEVVAKGPRPGRDVLLINCGASQDYVDRSGRTWRRDQDYQAP
ncbi:MAG TPA: malectin domain-containing carbohydrate-binding protein, partial [Planctomycetota bacterium]|nr:malectin domain-containing carbohydrate-binding protein [Planctomycetota bacterium]